MYVFPLPLVGPQPDALLFGVGDQLVPELGVGDGDELLRPLPGAAAHQVHAAVFGDDVVGQTPGIGDDIAGSQQRVDAGHHLPLLVGKRGRQTDEGLAALGHGGALQEVQLAAGAADLPGAGALGAYLAVQVHGDAVVDGHKVVLLAHVGGVVAVADGVCDHAGVFPDPVVQVRRANGETEDALVAIQPLVGIGDLAGLVHIQIAVTQHLRMDAQTLQIALGDHLPHGVGQQSR